MTDKTDGTDLPVWDRESFVEFTDWMPRPRVEKLLGLFRERARVAIVSLPLAASDVAWEKESHDLVYSAGTLGFMRLAARCRHVQAVIRKGASPTDEERRGLLEALAGALEVSDIAIGAPPA